MDKIVNKAIKIDLHIHSVYSKEKDGNKVAENTIDNLTLLINGLKNQEVGICAITDHDTFNFRLYEKLKEEENKDNCIKKVLPGIEFSVEFVENKVIHIVTIFDDKNEEKVKNIEKIMLEGIGKTRYKKTKGAYFRTDYFDILNEINTDFIMIAHQKKTVTSQHGAHANDVMSLGVDTFNELVFMDYFDAYEFRNKKNEIYNKVYIAENKLEENLRFVTGSDCHDWKYYPNSKENEENKFLPTYIKSLPTFKGVAMAVTDTHRIGLLDKFFNPVEHFIDNICMRIEGEEVNIPMSKGINVIIGDNSIGKSLFLNAITNNYRVSEKKLINGYKKYLDKHNIEVKTVISEDIIFKYNKQGEIRSIFDDAGMKPDTYLNQFYPHEINAEKYRSIVVNEFERLYESLSKKFDYDKNVSELPMFKMYSEDITDKSLIFIETVKKKKISKLQNLVDSFERVISDLKDIIESDEMFGKDKEHVNTTIQMLQIMQEKYAKRLDICKKENEKINIYNTYLKKYKQEYSRKITDEQAMYSDFVETKSEIVQNICNLVEQKNRIEEFLVNVPTTEVSPETNPVDNYKFVSKLGIEKIDNAYIEDTLSSVLRKGTKIDVRQINEERLRKYIKNYPNDDMQPIEALKVKINSKLDKDFKVCNTIVEDTMDVFEELSSGFDAQTYFTLISGETRNKGIYIIDQPEDHISQKAIKDRVLSQFRRMGQQRQVIIVTHNPQFIVNLDVDNVIFLSKENGKFTIKSGALEFEDCDYSILKIVADNIEGGLQTILGRMKRYEKNI